MVGLDTLKFEDISSDAPHTRQLVEAVLNKSQKIAGNVNRLHYAVEALARSQNAVSVSYRTLLTVLDSFFHELNEDPKGIGHEIGNFVNKVADLHTIFDANLRSLMLNRLEEYMTIFQDLSTESSLVSESCSKKDQVYHSYMKLPKKADGQTLQTASLELSNSRLEYNRSAVIHYKNLNQAEHLQEIIPLWISSSVGHILREHNKNMKRLLDEVETLIDSTIPNALLCATTADAAMATKFAQHAEDLQTMDLSAFCPEPWVLSLGSDEQACNPIPALQPNPRLSSKSGRLLLRTRVNLVWRWLDVFCHTQGGFLFAQKYDEVAASLLMDMQLKGVYVEVADYDDRRNVFQIVCPSERKTVVLQAESTLDRDEWIIALTNIIYDVNNLASRLSHAGVDNTKGSPTLSHIPSEQQTNPPLANQPITWDWSFAQLPPVTLDLPVVAELTQPRDNELMKTHRVESGTTPEGDHPSGSQGSVDEVLVEDDAIADPLDVAFLGAVELPSMLDSSDRPKLNDIFSYILSTRSSRDTEPPSPCRLLITNRDLWLLTSETETDKKHAPVLLRVPLSIFRGWIIHGENDKLACMIVKAPFEQSTVFSAAKDHLFFTFETDVAHQIRERILSAHLSLIDMLEPEAQDSQKAVLLANVSRLCEPLS